MHNEISFEIPIPDYILGINGGASWYKKLKPKKAAKEYGYYWTIHQTQKQGIILNFSKTDKFTVQLLYTPKNENGRDLDNIVIANKSMLDGICLALKINDKQITKLTNERLAPHKKNPHILFTLSKNT